MNTKRWIAIGVAVVLFVVSLGFQFVTSIFSTDFEAMFNLPGEKYEEEIIEEGTGNKIAVLRLEGVIQSSVGSNILSASSYNHQRFLEMLDEAGKDNSVDGVILRVNTPGGGVVESDEIYDKVLDIQEKYEKPVYVSMGNTAASGGYYVSAAAEKIVAHPATLTGSIGVIMESINYTDLADEYGIDFNTIKSGEFKDIMSSSRKMTEADREILQTMIDNLYADFVQVIVDGRSMSEAKVRELGDGRVYTGAQANENGLVDALGSMDDTIAMMKDDYDWPNAQVIEYKQGFEFGQFLNTSIQSMFGAESDLFGIRELLRESSGPRAMYLYSK